MTVFELLERLTGIGASATANGSKVLIGFPEERRREVEELGSEIQQLKPQLMRILTVEDITLALKVASHLETLPAHQSATASEIAEAIRGRSYTLDQMVEVYRICEELRDARIIVRGKCGYGYELCANWASSNHVPG